MLILFFSFLFFSFLLCLRLVFREDWLRKRLVDVRDEINNETLHIEHARQQKVKEAKLAVAHKSDLHKVKLMAVLKEKKRRIEVNRCLGMIRGGKDEVCCCDRRYIYPL